MKIELNPVRAWEQMDTKRRVIVVGLVVLFLAIAAYLIGADPFAVETGVVTPPVEGAEGGAAGSVTAP